MKICIISDLHLFSFEIGGNWSEYSFTLFKNEILPKVENEHADITVFLGDTLDPNSKSGEPRWSKGAKISNKFVKAIKSFDIKNSYMLKGNHDYSEPLKNISEMNGPKFVDDEWLHIKDHAFYFFTSRYPDVKKASRDIKEIRPPDLNVKRKILFMHENVSIKGAENIPEEVMEFVSKRFDMIFNGHQHFYDNPYKNVWCLSSALPWRPGRESEDLEIIWDDDIKMNEKMSKYGFYIINTDDEKIKFIQIDIGLKIITANLYFSNASADSIRKRLIELSKMLNDKFDMGKVILRIYLEGTMKEGDERIDVGFSDIEKKYFSNTYEGKSRKIIRAEKLKGGGAYLNKKELKYISIEDALKQVELEIPKVKEFYNEIYEIIEKKTFDGDTLIEKIKNSKILEEIEELKDDI